MTSVLDPSLYRYNRPLRSGYLSRGGLNKLLLLGSWCDVMLRLTSKCKEIASTGFVGHSYIWCSSDIHIFKKRSKFFYVTHNHL